MRMILRLWMLPLVIMLTGLLSGCQTYEKGLKYYAENPIITHRSPLVAVPAFTGMVTGWIAGLPLDIPGYLLANIILGPQRRSGETSEEYQKRLDEFSKDPNNIPNYMWAPSFVLGFAGQQAIGIPCWAAFGWWWPASEYSCLFGNVKKREPPCSPPVNGG